MRKPLLTAIAILFAASVSYAKNMNNTTQGYNSKTSCSLLNQSAKNAKTNKERTLAKAAESTVDKYLDSWGGI